MCPTFFYSRIHLPALCRDLNRKEINNNMKLSAPKKSTFYIALVLAVLGLLGALGVVGAVAGYAFWLAFVGYVVLALGNYVKGL